MFSIYGLRLNKATVTFAINLTKEKLLGQPLICPP